MREINVTATAVASRSGAVATGNRLTTLVVIMFG